MNFYLPVRLYTGSGCVRRHGEELRALGKRCTIVTGRTAAEKSGALKDVTDTLQEAGTGFTVFHGIEQNPSVRSCREAGAAAREAGAEYIIGIGGGSALDAAKAAAVFAANPALEEDGFYSGQWPADPLPIVLVGTTSGTGSEVTKVSVLTDSRKRKHSIHDDRLYARLAFGDSRYTEALPRTITLTTGIDVLAHCTESYFSRKADEISRAYAVRGVRLLAGPAGPLRKAAEGTELTPEDREQLYEASILGGMAINTTGTCFPHNVGYYLTENFGVPHGFASAAFLPELLEAAGKADGRYREDFFLACGISERALLDLTKKCLPEFNFTMTEQEIEDALPRWENNGSVSNTRADVDTAFIREMLLTFLNE